MCSVVRSKLANCPPPIALGKSAKPRFSNGENQLTGRFAADTRGRTRVTATENAVGTAVAIKGRVLSATAAEQSPVQITRARKQPTDPKLGRFRERHLSKVDRNRKGRRSTALRLSEVCNIMAAAVFTAQEHRPLNRHTTIHFDAAGIAEPVEALGRYTKLARDWLRMQGAEFSYIWVREAGDGKGEHAHLLMHVPTRLSAAFARRERGWRKRIGAKPASGAFKSTPVGRTYRHAENKIHHGEQYSDHLDEIVGYIVKGAEPRAVRALGLNRVAPGGELWGKRSGMSENIGRAARSRAGRIK